jgi:hypothetical protein
MRSGRKQCLGRIHLRLTFLCLDRGETGDTTRNFVPVGKSSSSHENERADSDDDCRCELLCPVSICL